jgi:hypothetical protein
MQVEFPRNTPVDNWVGLVLSLDCVQFLDTCIIQADIEFPISTL